MQFYRDLPSPKSSSAGQIVITVGKCWVMLAVVFKKKYIFLVFIRWPRLLPILNPDYVVKKIIHAVLTDQVYLLLPRSMYLIAALKKLVYFFIYFWHQCTEVTHTFCTHDMCGPETLPLPQYKISLVRKIVKFPFFSSFDLYWQQNCVLQPSFKQHSKPVGV